MCLVALAIQLKMEWDEGKFPGAKCTKAVLVRWLELEGVWAQGSQILCAGAALVRRLELERTWAGEF